MYFTRQFFFYLRDRKRRNGRGMGRRGGESILIHWFTPEILAVVHTESAWSQEPVTQWRSPIGMEGPSPLLSRVLFSRGWSCSANSGTSIWDTDVFFFKDLLIYLKDLKKERERHRAREIEYLLVHYPDAKSQAWVTQKPVARNSITDLSHG